MLLNQALHLCKSMPSAAASISRSTEASSCYMNSYVHMRHEIVLLPGFVPAMSKSNQSHAPNLLVSGLRNISVRTALTMPFDLSRGCVFVCAEVRVGWWTGGQCRDNNVRRNVQRSQHCSTTCFPLCLSVCLYAVSFTACNSWAHHSDVLLSSAICTSLPPLLSAALHSA